MNYGPTTAIARRPIATAVMHDKAATEIRKLASSVKDDLPGMHVHRHLADAAEQLGHRNKEGALRHLHAGMHALAPQSLMRHGIITDDEAAKAKAHMDAINRHALRLRDIQDLEGRNQNLRSAATAMNAPAHIGSGGTGGATNPGVPYSGSMKHLDAKPWAKAVSESAGGSLVGMSNQVELVGPKGYVHGWKYVGPQEQFRYGGSPGSFEHAQAIKNLGDSFVPGGELAIPYSQAPAAQMVKTALFHAARAMVMRQMNVANVHMDMAIKAARKLGPGQVAMLKSAKASLANVPKGALQTHHQLPKYNPNRPDINPNPLYIPAYGSTGMAISSAARDIRLSAETARLAVTPAPRGKPGGPGLYDVKGLGHSPYLQNIVKALIRGGMDPDKAYAVARGSIRKWARGGGNVHPEVRAAATAAEAQELKAQAQAHAHSNWDDVCQAIELAGTAWQSQARVPKGQTGGGQFTKGQQGGQQGKAGAKHVNAAVKKMSPQQKKHLKAQLLLTARLDRARAHQLGLQLRALLQSLNVSVHHTKTTNPAKAAARAKAAASTKARASATAKSGSRAASAASTRAQNLARVGQLRQQIHQLLQAASAAQKRASTL